MTFTVWAADTERRNAIPAIPNTFFKTTILATICHDAEGLFVAVTTVCSKFTHFISPL